MKKLILLIPLLAGCASVEKPVAYRESHQVERIYEDRMESERSEKIVQPVKKPQYVREIR